MKKIIAAFFSSLLLLSMPSVAETQLDRLLQLFEFESYQADFDQKTFDAEAKPLQELNGQLILQRPDKFFWESGEPFPQQIISDGKTIWHYDEDLEQVVVQQYSEQVENTPLLLILSDASKIKERFELASYSKKRQVEQFSLLLKDSNQSIKQVDIRFEKGVLSGLRFVDNLQQVTDINLNNRKNNQAVDAKAFQFEVPEDADILYE